jgi:hypothetical protein
MQRVLLHRQEFSRLNLVDGMASDTANELGFRDYNDVLVFWSVSDSSPQIPLHSPQETNRDAVGSFPRFRQC